MAEVTGWKAVTEQALAAGQKGLIIGSLAALGLAGSMALINLRRPNALLSITPGEMPACPTPVARHGLRQTINAAPATQQSGLLVQKIGSVAEDVPDTGLNPDRRTCL